MTGPSLTPTWQKILEAVMRARMRRAEAPPPSGLSVGGCLSRMVILVVICCIALVATVYFLGQALFQGVLPY